MRQAEQGGTEDHLGLVISETVFSAHLTYIAEKDQFELDLTDMEQFKPIEGYAALGGKATFVFDSSYGKYGRLRTTSISYGGTTYGPADFSDQQTLLDEKNNKWTGWRFAEKCFLSSLCAQTNLIMHVKALHMEIAAAFPWALRSTPSSPTSSTLYDACSTSSRIATFSPRMEIGISYSTRRLPISLSPRSQATNS